MGRRQYTQTHCALPLVDIEKLYAEISFFIQQARLPTLLISRTTTFSFYWNIRKLIVEIEYRENIREEDHQGLLSHLSKRLIKKFGKDFDFSNFEDCCKFYLAYPPAFKTQRAPNESVEIPEFQASLTWSHYHLLIHVSCPKARNFYEKEASNSNWSPLLLKQFIETLVFERLSTPTNKKSVLRSAPRGSLELFSENNNYLDKFMNK